MTFSERARRLHAIDECEKLMSKHCYYHSAGMHREDLDELWSKREDITFTLNCGQMKNRHSIFKNYVLEQEQRAFDHYMELKEVYPQIKRISDYRRMLGFEKPLVTNMVLEVAGDNQSAKGLWYTMGCIYTTLTKNQKIDARWLLQRHGADFVMENGAWKILNLRIANDATGLMDIYQWPLGQTEDEFPLDMWINKQTHHVYSPYQAPQNSPAIPEPYETLEKTFSYAEI